MALALFYHPCTSCVIYVDGRVHECKQSVSGLGLCEFFIYVELSDNKCLVSNIDSTVIFSVVIMQGWKTKVYTELLA